MVFKRRFLREALDFWWPRSRFFLKHNTHNYPSNSSGFGWELLQDFGALAPVGTTHIFLFELHALLNLCDCCTMESNGRGNICLFPF